MSISLLVKESADGISSEDVESMWKTFHIKANTQAAIIYWAQFRKFRRNLERRIRNQHREYISVSIGAPYESNNSKPFWNYGKTLNLTSFSIATWTNKSGENVFTPEEKANVPNQQFQSIFTEEQVDKAPGPDGIHALVLTQCADRISPILCKLFQAFTDSGYLPRDWRTANITPVFKKAIVQIHVNYRSV